MRIIPAIDIINGQCVRLTKGAYDTKKVYNENPLAIAQMFADKGFKFLHLVDLDGAKQGKPVNLGVLEQIAAKTSLVVDYGGGLRDATSVEMALNAGAAAITAGSIAAKNQTEVLYWLERWGAEKVIIGADTINGMVAVNGWQNVESIELLEFISDYLNKGAKRFICTDVSKDGMLLGSAVGLYGDLLSKFPGIKLVASGGVTSIDEVRQLKAMGLWGAIIGKAIYENKIDINELAKEV
ncbi:1-(5-phosphoribosyl)-5-[(5-phosphoribosylamino)methylideneamino]imidazole-4-carboxamide isomerase [uncultured Acetobacteroides sp.]|uniref:1-(5-phosphoribosyl)-5-[(5- phosphoribosylamino)methylideneamino]imidazole-4- carboxamide isomerase n=1 Tax=uncultured Acetobacteroides sp. TaxID=1760811 RepID=UPI0029F59A26|nr:1-(5-phosphoribosyl)-5-[(5-phosphoribosylamino)methylideneamino]imidazole-4-carboxamide isomerase [uncultured Acetobacteroides sp.]